MVGQISPEKKKKRSEIFTTKQTGLASLSKPDGAEEVLLVAQTFW